MSFHLPAVVGVISGASLIAAIPEIPSLNAHEYDDWTYKGFVTLLFVMSSFGILYLLRYISNLHKKMEEKDQRTSEQMSLIVKENTKAFQDMSTALAISNKFFESMSEKAVSHIFGEVRYHKEDTK